MSIFYLSQTGEDTQARYLKFLAQRQYSSNLSEAFKQAAELYDQTIRKLSQQAQTSIDNAEGNKAREIYQVVQIIAGSFLTGLAMYNAILTHLNSGADSEEIGELAPVLDWRLSLSVDQARIGKIFNDDIALLLHAPSSETPWFKKLEQGLSLYRDASPDNQNYARALQTLTELLDSGQTVHIDYVILHRIGLLYLYVPSLLDLAKAEAYLIKAAECMLEENDPLTKRLLSSLADAGARGLTEDFSFLMKRVAAESFFHAGVACYAQGELVAAADLFGKSRELFHLPEAGYLQAKCFIALGRHNDAAPILEDVIKAQRIYAFKAATDTDIFQKPVVLAVLTKLRDEAFREAAVHIQRCRSEMIQGSQAAPVLSEMEQRVKQRNYYAILGVSDDMRRGKKWKVMPTVFELKRMVVGHTLRVNSLNFSPDSSMLASASWKTIISNSDNGEEVRTFSGHAMKEFINATVFSPDCSKIATASSDTSAKVWDIKTGKEVHTLLGHKQSVNSVAFSIDGSKLATASTDKTIVIWDVKTGEKLKTLKGHDQSVASAVFSPDGSVLISTGTDNQVIYWDVLSWKKLRSLTSHTHSVTAAAFSQNGQMMATSSWDKTIKIWDFKTGREIKTLVGHSNGVDGVSFGFDDKNLASTSYNRITKVCEIKLWDVESGQEIQSLVGQFYAVAFSPDSSTLAVASGDKTVKLLSSPELSVDAFIALEKEARQEIEAAREAAKKRQLETAQKEPSPNETRTGEDRRRSISFWIGNGNRRTGEERRKA